MRKIKKILSITICIVLLCAIIPDFVVVPAEAGVVNTTLASAADYLYKPNTSPYFFNGTAIGGDDTGVCSYVRFDISGIQGTVTYAKIRLYCTDFNNNSTINLRKTAHDNLFEATPAIVAPGDLIYTFPNAMNNWSEIDVTSYVASEVNGGDGNVSFYLGGNPIGGMVAFSSREGVAPPQLVVTYNTPPTILSGALAGDNTYVAINFSEAVYAANNATGGLDASDFVLNFSQNGGTATGATITSVKKYNDPGFPMPAGAGSGWVCFTVNGTPSGVETIEIKPANASIFNATGQIMLTTQTTGVKTLNDQLPPTMLSAARNSDTQITVTLSENCTDIAKANSGGFTVAETSSTTTSYAVTAIAQGATANQVVLTVADMGVSGKEGVNVTYTAGGNGTVKDTSVNANAMATNSTGVAIVAWDTTPPAISSGALAANNAYIDVSMSEGVYTADNGTGALTPSDFALTFTPNGGTATGVSISSVKKPDNALEASASALSGEETVVRVFLNITGTPSGIETIKINPANNSAIYDKAGNAMLATQTTGVKTLNDKLPPTTTNAALNSNTKITLAVSEACTDIAKNNDGGFTIEQTGTPSITYAVNSVSEGSIILNTADMGVSAKEGVTVKYTPGGNGAIKDSAGNLMTSFTTTFAAWDTTPPVITTTSALAANNAYVDVSMSEGVYTADNGTGALTPSDFALNFLKNGGNATGVSISSVKKPDNALETSASALSGEETVVRVFLNITGIPSGIETIEIKPASASAVYDKAGNAMLTTQTTGVKTLKDQLPPTTTNAALNSNTKMTLALSEACTDIAKNNDGGFTIEQTGTPGITYAVNSVSEGSIILNTADMGVSAKEGVTVKYTPGGNGTIKDSAGNLMTSFTTTFAPWDTVAPTITTTSALAANNAYVDVSMSEGVYATDNGTGGLTPSDFALTFTKNAGNATGVSISSVKKPDNVLETSASALSGEETVVRVFLNITGTPSGIETIKINPASASAIYDKAGNAMLTTQTTGDKVLNDQFLPTMLSAARNSDTQITVTLSENCTDIAKANSGGFTVAETSSPTTSYAVTAIAQGATANQVVLTVADMGVSGKEGVNVTYTAGGNGTVKDTSVNANAMATNSTGVAIAAWDTTPPAITTTSAVAANNAYIDVSMSEGVYAADNGTGGLTPSDFALTFTKNAGNATGVSISSVKKPDNVLETSASALSGGETVVRVFLNITGTPSGIETIKINPASASAIYDKAGNAMPLGQTTGDKVLNDQFSPTMVSAMRNSNTQIVVTLSKNCTDITKANDGGFTVEQTGSSALTYAVTAIAQGATANQVVLTVADMGVSAKEGVTLKYTPGGNGTIKDIAGNSMASFTTTLAAWDTTPPAMLSAVRNSNTQMTVTLSENCTDITKANDGGFTVEQTSSSALTYAVTAIAQGATANQVVLTVADMSASEKEGVTLKYTPSGNGTIKDIAGNSMASFSTTFAAWYISNSSGSVGGAGGSSTIKENDNKSYVIIGGESYDDVMKLETGKTNDGRTEATITLNYKANEVIDKKPDGTSFKITFPSDYDINNLVMTGDIVKKMEEKSIVLDITANSSTFALPTADIKIDDVAKSFGDNVALRDITVKITISTPDANMSTEITKKAEEGGFSIVAPAVDFAINCTYKNNTVAITEFDSYVQNTTKLPDGITPEKITTAIYTSKDGEFHHVPTKIISIDGVYYAVVNSMTSGTFNFVYHFVSFPDVENHWSKAVVNDMASRFIVYGYENGLYVPDGDITRAEFATIVIRGMGLHDGLGQNTFSDISANDWYCGYVATACKYGLINGYRPESFGANEKITREQAITIIARAMKWTGLKVSLTDSEKDALLASFKDKTDISDYAKDSIAICIKSEIVVGRGKTTDAGISETTIKPKAFLTRAETAALVQRLLSKSGLI